MIWYLYALWNVYSSRIIYAAFPSHNSVSSVTQLCRTLCDPMDCSTPVLPVHHQLPEFAQTHVHWVGDAIQPSHPLSSPSPPTWIFPSIRVFSNKSVLRIRWPKYWSFRFNITPSNEYSGLVSFRMDWLDLLAVQGALKSLLQHHSSKASILWCSGFFIVMLSLYPYMTTGKTIALTRWTFVGKIMSLLFNRRQWHPTPVLLPGKSHAWRSLVGCSPWGRKESDMTDRLHFHFSLSWTGEGNGNPLQCSRLENPRDGGPSGLPSMESHRVGHD